MVKETADGLSEVHNKYSRKKGKQAEDKMEWR
jgi:hypothetical protein